MTPIWRQITPNNISLSPNCLKGPQLNQLCQLPLTSTSLPPKRKPIVHYDSNSYLRNIYSSVVNPKNDFIRISSYFILLLFYFIFKSFYNAQKVFYQREYINRVLPQQEFNLLEKSLGNCEQKCTDTALWTSSNTAQKMKFSIKDFFSCKATLLKSPFGMGVPL